MALAAGTLGGASLLSPTAIAGPLDLGKVNADSGWVVHVDVEAALTTVVGRALLRDRRSPLAGGMESLRGKLGISFASDVKSVTIFGESGCDDPGVAIVEMTDAADGLDERLGKLGLPGYARREFPGDLVTSADAAKVANVAFDAGAADALVIHSWQECDGDEPAADENCTKKAHGADEAAGQRRAYVTVVVRGRAAGADAAGIADRLVVLAPTKARLAHTLRVLAGEAPSAASAASAATCVAMADTADTAATTSDQSSNSAVQRSTILIVEVNDVPSLGPTAELTQRVGGIRMCLSEETPLAEGPGATAACAPAPHLVASAWLTTESPEAAAEVSTIVRNLIGFLDFDADSQPELSHMAAGLSRMDIKAEGTLVRLRMAAPAGDVAAFVRDSGRWMPQVIQAHQLASRRAQAANDSGRTGQRGEKGLPLGRAVPAGAQDIAEDRREHTP